MFGLMIRLLFIWYIPTIKYNTVDQTRLAYECYMLINDQWPDVNIMIDLYLIFLMHASQLNIATYTTGKILNERTIQ